MCRRFPCIALQSGMSGIFTFKVAIPSASRSVSQREHPLAGCHESRWYFKKVKMCQCCCHLLSIDWSCAFASAWDWIIECIMTTVRSQLEVIQPDMFCAWMMPCEIKSLQGHKRVMYMCSLLVPTNFSHTKLLLVPQEGLPAMMLYTILMLWRCSWIDMSTLIIGWFDWSFGPNKPTLCCSSAALWQMELGSPVQWWTAVWKEKVWSCSEMYKRYKDHWKTVN